jgi:hypothetical protein
VEEHYGREVGNYVVNAIGCFGREKGYDAEGRKSLEVFCSFALRLLVFFFPFLSEVELTKHISNLLS